MSTQRRKEEIARIQSEGAEAALAGKHRQVGIDKYRWNADCIQWLKGYDSVTVEDEEFNDE